MEILIQDATLVPMVRNQEYFVADLLIKDNKINKIDKNIQVSSSVKKINAKDMFVLPGFIQGHIHLVQTLLRHQADDLELLDWLRDKTWPFEASLSGDTAEVSSRLGLAELLCGGTTTICDYGTTHSHERVMNAVKQMGIRYIGGKTLMDEGEGVPQKLRETTESSLIEMLELGKKWHGYENRLIQYAVTPRFALSCTPELMKESVRLARDNGWYLQTHASENKSEIDFVKKKTGMDNIEYLNSLGFTGEDTILAHCIHLTEKELGIFEKTKTRVCHCPGSNLKLASGIADVPEMLKRKIPVLLGADGAPCNNRLSIFYEMSLTATLHKVKYGPRAMPAWDVLALATREAAKALRLESEIGTLEVGKKADLAILSRKSLAMQPDGDPASQIVFGAMASDVEHVFVDGKHIVENKRLIPISTEKIIFESQIAWKEVSRKMKDLK